MQQSTQFLLILLMFIGAAPGSTGGGIKVTVFAILIGAMYAMLRGKEDIVFFRKRLSKQSILRAITQTWLALFLVIATAMLLSAVEDRAFLALLFETTSAFATSGLSLDVTTQLTEFSKVVLSLVMFLGRIGPLTLAYALAPKSRKELFRYPEGDFIIG
ncbi:Ktr system potassium uptake protein B [compost metagenome]